MTAGALRALALVLLLPAVADAHRLDEYLQAARLAVSPDEVRVELDLTPGASVARAIAARIDRDADGVISPAEAEAYGRAVLADLELTVDGRTVPLTLTRVESSSIAEMLEGMGTVRLTMQTDVTAGRMSRMSVRFANRHAPGESVYLVNALKSADRRLVLERQSRDIQQQSIDLEYRSAEGAVDADADHVRSGALAWSLLGVSLVVGLVWIRT